MAQIVYLKKEKSKIQLRVTSQGNNLKETQKQMTEIMSEKIYTICHLNEITHQQLQSIKYKPLLNVAHHSVSVR